MSADYLVLIPSVVIVMAGVGLIIVAVGLLLNRLQHNLRLAMVVMGGTMFGLNVGMIISDLVFFPDLYRW